jgi:AcrR family transcriptional regulator
MSARPGNCGPGCQSCRRLRDAIVDLAYERGYQQLVVADVTERAGVSPAVFGEHVGTLEECLLAAYRDAGNDLFVRFATAFGDPGSWHERFARAIEAVLDRLADRPALAHLCFVESGRAGPRMRARRDAHMQRMIDLMAAEHAADELPALRFELLAGAVDRAISGHVADRRFAELPALTTRVEGITAVFEPVAA